MNLEVAHQTHDPHNKNCFVYHHKRLAWNSEQAATGNSTLPTVCDKLNIMASMHNRKLIAAVVRELNEKDSIIEKFEGRMVSLEDRLNQLSLEIKGIGADKQESVTT